MAGYHAVTFVHLAFLDFYSKQFTDEAVLFKHGTVVDCCICAYNLLFTKSNLTHGASAIRLLTLFVLLINEQYMVSSTTIGTLNKDG